MKSKKHKTIFSQNLIRLRKERGLSQQDLANLSGLTQRMIVYYENEAVKPPIDKIEIIAKVLKININNLLSTSDEPLDIQNELSQIDARTLKKLKIILSLPKQQRHMIYSMAESFLEKSNKKNNSQSLKNERYLVD
jgi:transcriptional regulator with XRE-family HTH domain